MIRKRVCCPLHHSAPQCIDKCSDLILSEVSETTLFTDNSTLSTNQTSEEESTSSGLFAKDDWNQQVFQHNLLVTLRCVTSLTNLTFWSANRSRLSKLFPLAMRVLSISASSAPVERVFSHGGLIMRPQHSRLSDQNFE